MIESVASPRVKARKPQARRSAVYDSPLARRVAERIQAAALTDRAAALAAGLGSTAIADIIHGKVKSPSAHNLHAIARVLGCDPLYLLGETDDPGEGAAPTVSKPGLARTINIASDGDGFALLDVKVRVPMSVAVKILSLIEGGE